MARKGQATSELPEWLSAFVSATQSQIEASRAQAERSERNFTALLAKLDQQEERHKDTTAALQQQLAQATNATPASGPPSAPPSRPPSAPPPAKLTPDLSLREFRAWRATWTDFFELSDGQRLSPDRQLHGCSLHGMPFHLQQWRPGPFPFTLYTVKLVGPLATASQRLF